MKIIKGNFGECRFQDCIEGMKQQKDHEFDLCLTDIPYNVDVGSLKEDLHRLNKNDRHFENKVFCDFDNNQDYHKFLMDWFELIKTKCNKIVFNCGNPNLSFWLKLEEPKEILFHYKSNCVSFTHSVRFARYDVILCYGKFGPFEFYTNVLDYPLENQIRSKDRFIHPCPKSTQLYNHLIERCKPKSVLDPFLGSGTTAEICESLGIPWVGYEIMEEYSVDIERKINRGKAKYSSKNIMGQYLLNNSKEKISEESK
jgi:DNA modification methylase